MMPNIEIPNLTESQKSYNAMQTNLLTVNTAINNLQDNEKERDKKVDKLTEVVLIGNGEIAIREQVRKNTDFINNVRYWLRFTGGIFVTWVVAQVILVIVAANWITTTLMPILTRIASQP